MKRENPKASPGPQLKITEKHRAILGMTAAGMTSKEIAAKLHSSPHTIDGHWRIIKPRLGARSRAHAVAIWLRLVST